MCHARHAWSRGVLLRVNCNITYKNVQDYAARVPFRFVDGGKGRPIHNGKPRVPRGHFCTFLVVLVICYRFQLRQSGHGGTNTRGRL
jgi:hypothetical protein